MDVNDVKTAVTLVRRVTLCKCDGEHCRRHSATCTLCHSNPETENIMKPRTPIGKFTALRLLYTSSLTVHSAELTVEVAAYLANWLMEMSIP
ncbi:hypothetical protein T12_1744 [Trichinella patagoniensis]|uniref:Uncharacterized protein n=1 Tax=Trichinella patagoniensis TaxID=990121 RepID=A0A0V0ZPV8_9BILA|nr:hypothetical protein T12_1744 [Trichinella patagoniensis]